MQIHAPYACTALYKAGWPEKGLSKGKRRAKKSRWGGSGIRD